VFLVTRNKNEADERRDGTDGSAARRFSRRSDTSTFKKRLYVGKKERERERERERKGEVAVEGASGGEKKERDSAEAESVCPTRYGVPWKC